MCFVIKFHNVHVLFLINNGSHKYSILSLNKFSVYVFLILWNFTFLKKKQPEVLIFLKSAWNPVGLMSGTFLLFHAAFCCITNKKFWKQIEWMQINAIVLSKRGRLKMAKLVKIPTSIRNLFLYFILFKFSVWQSWINSFPISHKFAGELHWPW